MRFFVYVSVNGLLEPCLFFLLSMISPCLFLYMLAYSVKSVIWFTVNNVYISKQSSDILCHSTGVKVVRWMILTTYIGFSEPLHVGKLTITDQLGLGCWCLSYSVLEIILIKQHPWHGNLRLILNKSLRL